MVKLIKHSGLKQKKIPRKAVASLLGAEVLPERIRHKKSPLSALRELTRKSLHSKGGRPSLKNIEKVRRKISFIEGDFSLLEELSKRFSDKKRKVGPSQLAACLINEGLKNLERSLEKQ